MRNTTTQRRRARRKKKEEIWMLLKIIITSTESNHKKSEPSRGIEWERERSRESLIHIFTLYWVIISHTQFQGAINIFKISVSSYTSRLFIPRSGSSLSLTIDSIRLAFRCASRRKKLRSRGSTRLSKSRRAEIPARTIELDRGHWP
jgi:hypothetical protein